MTVGAAVRKFGDSWVRLTWPMRWNISVMNVIQVAQHVSGKTIRVKTAPRRPGDQLVRSADRAKALLDWMPKRSAPELQIADA